MEGYINDLLKARPPQGRAATPAATTIFNVRESPALSHDQRKEFHTAVAKLLYLAKRIRSDILQAVAFLTGRVQSPTQDDLEKLDRIYNYLNSTRDLELCLGGVGLLVILAFVDAAFGLHSDGKSHTGIIISLGLGTIYAASQKQRIVTKSSSEAELVGISDALSQIIWTRNFLELQGYSLGPAIIFQDNTSTISLANKGKAQSQKTRHIHVRYYFIKDRISSNEVQLQYKPTAEMASDILTKGVQGSLFRRLRDRILGRSDMSAAGGTGRLTGDDIKKLG
jgi:hypothetical protein